MVDFDKICEKIAKQHGISKAEVIFEIKKAKNQMINNPQYSHIWNKYKGENYDISPQKIIEILSEMVIQDLELY